MNQFLGALGFEQGYRHPFFGDSSQVLNHLTSNKIISIVKGANKSIEYSWGQLAHNITNEKEVSQFAAKVKF